MQKAAHLVVSQMGGKIPDTWDELISLPGIGDYTTGAILSFAFGRPVPAIDGNVKRVLCRLYAIHDPVDQIRTRKKIHELTLGLVDAKDPSSFNQALMELGATVCMPRNPLCSTCPIQIHCLAHKEGLQESLPIKQKRGPIPHKEMTAAIIKDKNNRLLIVQRRTNGLLGGLWKFPGGERSNGESLKQALERSTREELGIDVKSQKALASVNHAYTHFRITLHAFQCSWIKGNPRVLKCDDWKWVNPGEFADYPFSKADRKVISELR